MVCDKNDKLMCTKIAALRSQAMYTDHCVFDLGFITYLLWGTDQIITEIIFSLEGTSGIAQMFLKGDIHKYALDDLLNIRDGEDFTLLISYQDKKDNITKYIVNKNYKNLGSFVLRG